MVYEINCISHRLKINDNMSDRKGETGLARQLKTRKYYKNG
jgi:hypothetical protein